MSSLKEHQNVLLELLQEFDRVCRKNNINYIVFAGSALGAVRHQGFIPWDDDLDVALLREDYDKLLKLDASEWNDQYYMQCEFSDHWPMHFSKLRKNNTTCLEKYHPKDNKTHQGIYIDVFPCDNARTDQFLRKIQYLASRVVISKTMSRRGYETNSILKKITIAFCRLLPLAPFHRIVTDRKNNGSNLVHTFLGGTSRFEKGSFDRRWFTEIEYVKFETMEVPVSKYCHEMLTQQYGDYMTLPPESERAQKVHALLVDTEKNYTEYEHYRDGITFDVLTRSIR